MLLISLVIYQHISFDKDILCLKQ